MTDPEIKQQLFGTADHPTPPETHARTVFDLATAYRGCGQLSHDKLQEFAGLYESLVIRPAMAKLRRS